jgi:hypothetical protein
MTRCLRLETISLVWPRRPELELFRSSDPADLEPVQSRRRRNFLPRRCGSSHQRGELSQRGGVACARGRCRASQGGTLNDARQYQIEAAAALLAGDGVGRRGWSRSELRPASISLVTPNG